MLSAAMVCCLRVLQDEHTAIETYTSIVTPEDGWYSLLIENHFKYKNREVFNATLTHQKIKIKTQITIWNAKTSQQAFSGDTIQAALKFSKTQQSPNKYIFPYDQYLFEKNIYLKAHCSVNTYMIKSNSGFSVMRVSQQISHYLRNIATKYQVSDLTEQLLNGILLGDKTSMDKETKEAFRTGGISHILAVSGMHLGILYMLLSFLFSQVRKLFKGLSRRLEITMTFTFIWMFTLVTGMGVAVCRAALMLSIYLLGKILRRQNHSLNTLFATAFFLAFYDPSHFKDIGYQLSCLAMLGIFWLSKYFSLLYIPVNRWSQYFWQVVSVSFSVQLIILPVCLYHFSSAPTYFLLSNLMWAPLTPILMVLGILAWIGDFIAPPFADLMMQICDWLINKSMFLLNQINTWPHALIENLWFELEDGIAFGMLFLLFKIYLQTRNRSYMATQVLILVVVMSHQYYRENQIYKTKKFVIYPKGQSTAYLVLQKGQGYTTDLKIAPLETYLKRNYISTLTLVSNLEILQLFPIKNESIKEPDCLDKTGCAQLPHSETLQIWHSDE